MTNQLLRSKSAPKRALGKYDSDHIANQNTMELIQEKDSADVDNETMISVILFEPTDPDEFDAQIRTLGIAQGNPDAPYFR